MRPAGALALVCLFAAGCRPLKVALGTECADFDYGLPASVSPPPHPPGTCVRPARVALGRKLFYDKRLSLNEKQSCASCHIQKLAFTDGKQRAEGSTGQVHPRNTISLTNVGYRSAFNWATPAVVRLENQALVPLFSEDTATNIIELGMAGQEGLLADRLRADPEYVRLFKEAFGKDLIDVTRVAKALAVFQTTMISYQSAYDRGELTESAIRGKALFYSKAGCSACHGGVNFNEDQGGAFYVNIGLYNVGGAGDYPDHSLHGAAAAKMTQGVHGITRLASDRGRFRIPSLRNAAVTAPYMHDGSIATLEEAVEHFNQGGRLVAGPLAGDGRLNPNKDPRIRPLGLSAQEKSDLVEFLRSLTDECFLTDPRYSNPAEPAPPRPAACR